MLEYSQALKYHESWITEQFCADVYIFKMLKPTPDFRPCGASSTFFCLFLLKTYRIYFGELLTFIKLHHHVEMSICNSLEYRACKTSALCALCSVSASMHACISSALCSPLMYYLIQSRKINL